MAQTESYNLELALSEKHVLVGSVYKAGARGLNRFSCTTVTTATGTELHTFFGVVDMGYAEHHAIVDVCKVASVAMGRGLGRLQSKRNKGYADNRPGTPVKK